MYKILLISGKQGAGKTSLQNEIANSWQWKLQDPGSRAIEINFADIIYSMHDFCIGKLHSYYPRDIKKDGPLLQLLGTEWARNTIDKNIWVNVLKARIKELSLHNSHYKNILFIIGDCRFENEFDGFPEALKVRLEAAEHVRQQRCSAWRDRTDHPSEIGLDKYSQEGRFDLLFETDGNLSTTYIATEVIDVLKDMKGIDG